jgi:hypothetical protein
MLIYEAEAYVFGIISSLMHMTWVNAVSGRLESRISYSNVICYNTFPFPILTIQQKAVIATLVLRVIEERENHSEKSLADLYDPDLMPESLRVAHGALDEVIDKCYREKPFENEEERLAHLFKLYEKMIGTKNA